MPLRPPGSRFGPTPPGSPTRDRVAECTLWLLPSRLPECRASQGGYPQWGASGHLKVDDGPEQTFEISEVADGERVAREATMTVPFGESLHLWFSVNDRYGCFQQDDGAVFDLGE